MEYIKDIKKIINNEEKNTSLYDYICNNYYQLDKIDLAEIIKELNFAIYSTLPQKEYKKIMKIFIENLEERNS